MALRDALRAAAARVRGHGHRALVVLLAATLLVQLSGIAHVVFDLFASPDEMAAHFTAEGEDDGDCPPGCPTCHHANGGVAAPTPPPANELAAPLPPLDGDSYGRPSAWAMPPRPELPSLFRPPRSAA